MTELFPEANARPGTQFYAPQARLVSESGQPILIDGQSISPDLISARITQVNTGISQVELVLNNQRHDRNNRLVWPSWKYNGLDPVSFGNRIRIDLRYGSEGWTPMMLARITDVVFAFPPTAGATVTLKGEDLLSLLKAQPENDVAYSQKTEIQMVEEELRASGSGLTLAGRNSPFSAPLASLTHEKARTYQQFIESMAERMDFELFVDFDNPDPMQGDGARPVKLHFEEARSRRLDKYVSLQWGRDIVEFKPSFKVWDVLTDAVSSGTQPGRRERYSEAVTMAQALDGELHAAPGGAPAPITAAVARERAFRAENRPEANSETIAVANLDQARGRVQAMAKLRTSARQFLTADITTIGFTRLRPGIHVELRDLYAPFDGIYYVTQAIHTLSAEMGYITRLSVRRPGMLDPSRYPTATPAAGAAA
jgi:hypothetical protein